MTEDPGTGPPGPAPERIEPLGAPTDPLRPTGRVRGGGAPVKAPWAGRLMRRLVGVLIAAVVVAVLLALIGGSLFGPGWLKA